MDDRDKANAPAEAAAPALQAWAQQRGLNYEQWWSLPQATQLLRHGFMQEVRSLGWGAVKGLPGEVQIAHADFATQEHGFDAHWFTVVVVRAPASQQFATRIVCHDRGLSKAERSNPDAGRQIIELDDQAVRLESEDFLKRYTLSADHDQDQVRTWQIFDPSTLEWLTKEAPPGFSFELQDGALCCFVKALLTEPAELDALCAATARIFERVDTVAAGQASTASDGAPPPPAAGSRSGMVEERLAKHTFAEPPKSVRAAAKALGGGLVLSDEEWKLGAEAFFREYAKSIGMKAMELSEFRANVADTAGPGILEHVAAGPLPGTEIPGFLALSADDTMSDLGWMTLFAKVLPGGNSYNFANDPEAKALEDDGYDWSGGAKHMYTWHPDNGTRHRKRTDIENFIAKVAPVLARLVRA